MWFIQGVPLYVAFDTIMLNSLYVQLLWQMFSFHTVVYSTLDVPRGYTAAFRPPATIRPDLLCLTNYLSMNTVILCWPMILYNLIKFYIRLD